MRGSLFVGCAAALATVALVLALVSQGQHPRRTVLTFADGTVLQPLRVASGERERKKEGEGKGGRERERGRGKEG